MALEHLPASATPEAVATAVARDGAVIVDHLVAPGVMDRIEDELRPYIEATRAGPDAFSGHNTRRTGGLVARSPACRDLIMHPLILGTAAAVLHKASSFHIHLTQVISIGPGEPAQPIHRDQWAFDYFPFPDDYEAQLNTIWAMTDFTEANGATRVIPGSNHREDRLRLGPEETVPAEMTKGSVLVYSGRVYHGGGANRSDQVRRGINLTYAASWLRQEENQYLSTPLEVARTLPVELLKLMGYRRGAYALGYVDDLRDPLEVLWPDKGRRGLGEEGR